MWYYFYPKFDEQLYFIIWFREQKVEKKYVLSKCGTGTGQYKVHNKSLRKNDNFQFTFFLNRH